jgi:hypothetical protein
MDNYFLRFGNYLVTFVEYILNPFSLHLFSFFDAHDSQVWSLDGVIELLSVPYAALDYFV